MAINLLPKKISKKINCVIANLIVTGLVLCFLGVMIVWSDWLLRVLIGLVAIVGAYAFFYLAYKIWSIKREVEKHFKI